MAIKFSIFQIDKKGDKPKAFSVKQFSEKKTEIKFGREDTGNDIILKDEKRQVSNPHALLTLHSGKIILTDLGSKNKTFVDGKQLKPNQPVEVTATSKIEMANFLVSFFIELESDKTIYIPPVGHKETKEEFLPPKTPEISKPDNLPGSIDEPPKIDLNVRSVAEELRILYKNYSAEDNETRKLALIKLLEQKMQTIKKIDSKKFLIELKNEFPDRGYDLKSLKLENEELKKEIKQWTGDKGIVTSSYKAISKLASELITIDISFNNTGDIEKFCDQIKNTIESLLNSFSDLDKGRKRILEDFIDIWDEKEYESPLLSKTSKEMTQILLDWRNDNSHSIERSSMLEKSLQILIVHELALLKGYQNATYQGSLKILDNLDPKKIAKQIEQKNLNIGPLTISYKYFPPLIKLLTWREYVNRHRQWMNEDRDSFETIFRSSFADRYKETVSRAKRANQNLNKTRFFYRENIKDIKSGIIK